MDVVLRKDGGEQRGDEDEGPSPRGGQQMKRRNEEDEEECAKNKLVHSQQLESAFEQDGIHP